MKVFVNRILKPYHLQIVKKKSLEPTTKLVWLIDSWSVQDFRNWLLSEHGTWLKCLYVPANCTSKCQPCDVILNRPFKASFRRCFQSWVIDETEKKFKVGDDTPISFKADVIKEKSAEFVSNYLL
jgi:hypothetical protein